MAAAAERFAVAADRAIAASGRFVVSLAGGSTPEMLYRLLAMEPYRSRVGWPSVQVFWGDERCVPPDHAASNYGMSRRALLDSVALLPENIYRIRGEDPPHAAADAYEATLRSRCPAPAGCFDLVLLGLGRDGHTASLFPGSGAVRERSRWVCAVSAPAPPSRITLTPVILAAAREVVFLVTGPEKASALNLALHGPEKPDQQPAQAVASGNQHVRWLVDSLAAGQTA
jgi:6-phosphogluconolactonase